MTEKITWEIVLRGIFLTKDCKAQGISVKYHSATFPIFLTWVPTAVVQKQEQIYIFGFNPIDILFSTTILPRW